MGAAKAAATARLLRPQMEVHTIPGEHRATPGVWVEDGLAWRTACNTAATGLGVCHNYVYLPRDTAAPGGYTVANGWVLNSQVLFS